MDNWSIPQLDLRPILPGKRTAPSWPLAAQEITAEEGIDGGTFYRPEAPTWHNGTAVTPADSLGEGDDYYLNTARYEWWGPKVAGDPEDEEDHGTWAGTGPTAIPGDTWINGSGDPEDDTGSAGNCYLDVDGHAYWGPKTTTWTDTGPNYIAAGWIVLIKGPVASGLFSMPGCSMGNGDPEDDEACDVSCSLEIADEDGRRIASIPVGSMSATGGIAAGVVSGDELVELSEEGVISKARWKISGGANLTWSAGGSWVKLR